jgi:CRP-like cAMP-binding protein
LRASTYSNRGGFFAERRPIKLNPEEQEVRDLIFRELPPRKFLQVLSIGSWATVKSGDRLLELIVRGKVRVTRDARVLGELAEGDIVGSALILSGASADVDAVAVEEVRSVRWDLDPLDQYLAGSPETRIILQKYMARDLAGKLNRSIAT